VVIYALSISSFKENQLSLNVHCSKGTYIRTLVEDIGKKLGCGAYTHTLHRTCVGSFQEMVDFKTLMYHAEQGLTSLDHLLLPMHVALKRYPTLELSANDMSYLRQGQTIQISHALTEGLVKLFVAETHATGDSSTNFLGIGQVLADGRIAPKRLFNI
jgi:tRNA pseudouridine55 synthase